MFCEANRTAETRITILERPRFSIQSACLQCYPTVVRDMNKMHVCFALMFCEEDRNEDQKS